MPSSASILALAALLGPALASPPFARSDLAPRDNVCPQGIHFQANDWCSANKDDSVVLFVNDNEVQYGLPNPGDIITAVREGCKNGACKEESSLKSLWVKDRKATAGDLKIKMTTGVTDPVHLEPMLQSLQVTLDRVAKFRTEEYIEATVCPPSTGAQCPSTKKTVPQCNGPAVIVMQIREKDNSKDIWDRAIVSHITLEFTPVQKDALKGLCATLGGIGTAAAGLINPALGAIGSLAMVGCWFAKDG